MNRLKNLIMVFAGSVLAVATFSQVPEYRIQVTPLDENIYKLTCDVTSYTVNMVAFTGPDGVLLVDAGVKETDQKLKEIIDTLGIGPPDVIIYTHAHVDHSGGGAIFGEEPIIIAHDVVRTRLRSGRYIIEEIPDHALPDITFTDSLTLYFNGEKIRIIAIPGSHSDNDVIVHFTKSGIACMGDLSYGMKFPSVDGISGNALKYSEAIQRAIEFLPGDVTLVSGHGKDCTIDELRQFNNMITETIAVVKKGLAEGKDAATLKKEDILSEWASYGDGYNSANYWIQQIDNNLQNIKPKKTIIEPLYLTLKEKGIDETIKKYYELKNNHHDEYIFGENKLAYFGYKLLERDSVDNAVRILELNAKEYPDSWITYDCLGECYLAKGDKEKAIKYYRKSLEINPDNTNALEMLKNLEAD